MRRLVLLVDDSEASRAVIRFRLEDAGFRVNEASDGAEGAVAALLALADRRLYEAKGAGRSCIRP